MCNSFNTLIWNLYGSLMKIYEIIAFLNIPLKYGVKVQDFIYLKKWIKILLFELLNKNQSVNIHI